MGGFDSSGRAFYSNESVRIRGTTKLYGIVGWPVAHSLSPLFQSLFLQQRGLDAVYVPFGVEPGLLKQALDGLWALGVEGFNVTVPHKEAVFQQLTCDDVSRMIGAVNTVRRARDGWQATNTDWRGFLAVLEGSGYAPADGQVLLFGAGGTARAVLHALAGAGPARVLVCNRNPGRLQAFVSAARRHYPDLDCQALPWEQQAVSRASRASALLINTTSIGLKDGDVFPFELAGEGMAVDAVYSPSGRTAFTRAAAGRKAVDGLPMLIAQGAESFAWWHDGARPDRLQALRWIENYLGRAPVDLPSWSAA